MEIGLYQIIKELLKDNPNDMDLGKKVRQILNAWNNGYLLIQEAFPELSPEAREFIKNGITEEEWQKYIVEGLPIPKIA